MDAGNRILYHDDRQVKWDESRHLYCVNVKDEPSVHFQLENI
jgi:hypothetical protein